MTQLTFFGHSCFLVETMGVKILFDPFIAPNELAKDIDVDSINCDYILVSHCHWDHIADLEYLAKKTGAKVLGSFELHTYLNSVGISNTHPMNVGGTCDFGFGSIRMVAAVHSNSFPNGNYGGVAAGYVIKNEHTCFYYSGDTAVTYDMKLIADMYLLNFAMLPIGGNFTMNVDDAIMAAGFVGCKQVVGMHFDTFGYIKINHDAAVKAFADKNLSLTLMQIGETRSM
jgi:L-ascorbate metabolism protein UlaG (beta-lactamase superfamily)